MYIGGGAGQGTWRRMEMKQTRMVQISRHPRFEVEVEVEVEVESSETTFPGFSSIKSSETTFPGLSSTNGQQSYYFHAPLPLIWALMST